MSNGNIFFGYMIGLVMESGLRMHEGITKIFIFLTLGCVSKAI
jgi:hypothetical protein